ncbi:MAG: cardiolipin synthase [Lachnospiraceae bacterium]|nr:cardiolipin synthase [Lachnospiraceae bacterium]
MFYSRAIIYSLLIILQFTLFILFILRFRTYFHYYTIIETVIASIIILYMYAIDMDPSAKLSWAVLMIFMPLAGSIMFLFSQMEVGHRHLRNRSNDIVRSTMDTLGHNESVLDMVKEDYPGLVKLHDYINTTGCFPLFGDTETKYYPSGESFFEDYLKELEKAKNYIFIEYFIIGEGYMWGKILDVLKKKAEEGVEIRVLYDGVCEFVLLPHNYPSLLAGLGIKARTFSSIVPMLSTYYNYRDHRKITVIDGKCAFTGGLNLSDEYINIGSRFGHWKDGAVKLKGDAAISFTLMFLQMWDCADERSDDKEDYLKYFPNDGIDRTSVQNIELGYVMPYADCPLDGIRVGEDVYIDMFYSACDHIYVMTPYLVMDGEMKAAMVYAAQRGVDVRVIIPGIPDKKVIYSLAKVESKSLIKSGIKIYEYTPGFLHTKAVISDDTKAVVGTINMDYRSLYHHFECAAYMYKTPCIADIRCDFEETFKKCREVTLDTIRHDSFFYKILGTFMRFLAPLF